MQIKLKKSYYGDSIPNFPRVPGGAGFTATPGLALLHATVSIGKHCLLLTPAASRVEPRVTVAWSVELGSYRLGGHDDSDDSSQKWPPAPSPVASSREKPCFAGRVLQEAQSVALLLPQLQFVLPDGAADGHVVHREMSADFCHRIGTGLVG